MSFYSFFIDRLITINFCSIADDAKAKRQEEEEDVDRFEIERPHTVSIMRHPSDRRADQINNVTFAPSSDPNDLSLAGATALFQEEERNHSKRRDSTSKSKSAPVSVSRSESYRERSQRKSQREKRKTSDPSLGKDNL